jgi:hypothetical protein
MASDLTELALCRAWTVVEEGNAIPPERHYCTRPRGHLAGYHLCDCGHEWGHDD